MCWEGGRGYCTALAPELVLVGYWRLSVVIAKVAVVAVSDCSGVEAEVEGGGESGSLGVAIDASRDCPEWSAARMETGIVEVAYGGGDKVEEE